MIERAAAWQVAPGLDPGCPAPALMATHIMHTTSAAGGGASGLSSRDADGGEGVAAGAGDGCLASLQRAAAPSLIARSRTALCAAERYIITFAEQMLAGAQRKSGIESERFLARDVYTKTFRFDSTRAVP